MSSLVIVVTSVGIFFTVEKTITIPMATGCEEAAKLIHQVNENTVAYCING